MLQPLPLRRPACPIPENIPCRFRVQGRCCHAGFAEQCPIPSMVAALAPAGGLDWVELERGADEEPRPEDAAETLPMLTDSGKFVRRHSCPVPAAR